MLRGSNLSDDLGVRLADSDLVYLEPELVSKFERSLVTDGDLIFTCWGSVGQIGLIDGSARHKSYIVSNKQMKFTPDTSKVHPLFLYYYLSQRRMVELVKGQAIGSTIPGFNLGQLKSLPISYPALTEQQAIVDVLGALDDKIATNTKLSAAVDDFLGARFQRELAAGFEFASLKDIADVNAEAVKPVANQSLRYIDIASVGVGTHTFPRLISWEDAPSRARRRVRRGDTLWSTVRPNRRSHSLNLSSDPALVGSTGLAVLSPKDVGFAYLYETTRLPEFTTYLENVAEGSAYPAVRAEQFKSAPVPLLSPEKRVAFENLAAPMREHAHALDEENRTLAELRDTLLPELMSGRLRVKDAEKKVEEVV